MSINGKVVLVTGSETYRPWNWADRVLGEHGDALHQLDDHHEGVRQVEQSRWWWMEKYHHRWWGELMAWVHAR